MNSHKVDKRLHDEGKRWYNRDSYLRYHQIKQIKEN
jgi:hypothetical protein